MMSPIAIRAPELTMFVVNKYLPNTSFIPFFIGDLLTGEEENFLVNTANNFLANIFRLELKVLLEFAGYVPTE